VTGVAAFSTVFAKIVVWLAAQRKPLFPLALHIPRRDNILLLKKHVEKGFSMSTSLWVTRVNPQAQLRLFSFPYAGGGASIYRQWSRSLPPEIDLCPVQLPGRENRLKEPLFTSLTPLIETLARELMPYLDRPFAFFGHSMGALISFELARYLRRHSQLEPLHLFVSAHRAPQIPLSRELLHNLAAPEFLRSVYRMGGTPSAVLLDKELIHLLLPILRADFTVYETYAYQDDEPLNSRITAFGGEQDAFVKPQDLEGWREQTHSTFSLRILPGGHFFLQTHQQLLLQILAHELSL
jgi:surfactin synthase thioesterase subunit